MSVTVTVSRVLLEEFPEVNYQLFYLSSREEEREFTCAYTARRYYRELTDLLDLYQIPYEIASSLHPSLLHVLIADEKSLAAELQRQLEQWGFESVEMVVTSGSFASTLPKNRKRVSLALLDEQMVRSFSFGRQAGLLIRLVGVPLVFLMARLHKSKPAIGFLAKTSWVLYKPFSQSELQESVERVLDIALISS